MTLYLSPIELGCRRTSGNSGHIVCYRQDFPPILTIWPSYSYISPMTNHSVADAKNNLSALIDRALEGEGVVITRHGRPVVELRPVKAPARAITAADIDWLARHRVGRRSPRDTGQLVSEMRDEEWR